MSDEVAAALSSFAERLRRKAREYKVARKPKGPEEIARQLHKDLSLLGSALLKAVAREAMEPPFAGGYGCESNFNAPNSHYSMLPVQTPSCPLDVATTKPTFETFDLQRVEGWGSSSVSLSKMILQSSSEHHPPQAHPPRCGALTSKSLQQPGAARSCAAAAASPSPNSRSQSSPRLGTLTPLSVNHSRSNSAGCVSPVRPVPKEMEETERPRSARTVLADLSASEEVSALDLLPDIENCRPPMPQLDNGSMAPSTSVDCSQQKPSDASEVGLVLGPKEQIRPWKRENSPRTKAWLEEKERREKKLNHLKLKKIKADREWLDNTRQRVKQSNRVHQAQLQRIHDEFKITRVECTKGLKDGH